MPEHQAIRQCRGCGAGILRPVMDFGTMPLADGLVVDGEQALERRYPLTVVFCPECSLLQIRETVPPEILYSRDYPYFSSFSDTVVDHARRNVEALVERYHLGPSSLVIEIASNDGYLLQWFAERGVPVLGVDPSPGPAAAARDRGIPTLGEFFDQALADRLVTENRQADVVIANNLLAHVPDQRALVAAIARVLKPEGVVMAEFPYVKDLVDHTEFDTIYHEHHCYFSLTSVGRLFARQGLPPTDVEHHDIHGGSLRVHFGPGKRAPSVGEYLQAEEQSGLTDLAYYQSLADRAAETRRELVALLDRLKASGARLAAYGAAAKGAVMLNFCGVGTERLDYVVDRNVHKQGKLMPGVHVPIVGPERLQADPPDYLLLLAWNFKEEILAQQQEYAAAGGRFLVPVPYPEVLDHQVLSQA